MEATATYRVWQSTARNRTRSDHRSTRELTTQKRLKVLGDKNLRETPITFEEMLRHEFKTQSVDTSKENLGQISKFLN